MRFVVSTTQSIYIYTSYINYILYIYIYIYIYISISKVPYTYTPHRTSFTRIYFNIYIYIFEFFNTASRFASKHHHSFHWKPAAPHSIRWNLERNDLMNNSHWLLSPSGHQSTPISAYTNIQSSSEKRSNFDQICTWCSVLPRIEDHSHITSFTFILYYSLGGWSNVSHADQYTLLDHTNSIRVKSLLIFNQNAITFWL